MAGNGTLPVDSFLVHLDAMHTQQEIYNLLNHAIAPGAGITLHEVNKLSDHDYRISIHVAPVDRANGERLVKDLLETGLAETVAPVEIDTAPVSVARETAIGIGSDVNAIFDKTTMAIGRGISSLLNAGNPGSGPGLGTIAIVLGLGALVVGGVLLSRRAS